jgi:hypothetical protein
VKAEEAAVTVSMRVMSAGNGYKYLLRTVAAIDGQRSLSTPLTSYYSAKGTPPGRWMGTGLPGLGSGRILEGAEVTEDQLERLVGLGRDPVDGVARIRNTRGHRILRRRVALRRLLPGAARWPDTTSHSRFRSRRAFSGV